MHRPSRRIAYSFVILMAVIAVAVAAVQLGIASSTNAIRAQAMQLVPDAADGVEALQTVALDDAVPFRDRNRAIWALGRLEDPRAVSVLRRLERGEACRHEADVCQREVRKAIARCTSPAS